MQFDKRSFIIFNSHRRWQRLWQFFFTGWGLVMVAALVAGALFTKQLLWTPISAVNMSEIMNNQFQMTNASFSGTDKNGEPFSVRAAIAKQEYNNQDTIYMERITGNITRKTENQKIVDKITANRGKYSRKNKTLTLLGNVRVDSSNGDKILTDELVVQL